MNVARVTTLSLSGYTIELTKKLFQQADEKYVQLMLIAAQKNAE